MNHAWALNPYKHLLRPQSVSAASAASAGSAGAAGAAGVVFSAQRKRRRVIPRRSPGNQFDEYKKRGYLLYCPGCDQEHLFASDKLLQCPQCGATHLEGLPPSRRERTMEMPPPRRPLSAR